MNRNGLVMPMERFRRAGRAALKSIMSENQLFLGPARNGRPPTALMVRLRVIASVALVLAPAFAAAQTATVDQVLAAVAEVVRDRAKQVASRAIASGLTNSLCSGTVTLPPYRPPVAQGRITPATRTVSMTAVSTATDVPDAPAQPSSATPLILYLGGKQQCRDAYLGSEAQQAKASALPSNPVVPAPGTIAAACDADDVFIRTCRLAKRFDVPLTDAYFLKSLSRDTVEFLMRVAARNLSATVYKDSGLVEIGAFIHAILEQLGQKKPSPRELADPTLALADRLSADLPRRTFKDLWLKKLSN